MSLVRLGSQKVTLFLYKGQKFVSLVQLGYMKKWTFIMLVNKGHKNKVRFKYGLKNSGFFVTS